MSKYIKLNALPIIIEIVFIISCFIVTKEYYIYTNFVFYLSLLIIFIVRKEFSLKEWIKNIKSGKKFWKQVIITSLFFILAFGVTIVLENRQGDGVFVYNNGTIEFSNKTDKVSVEKIFNRYYTVRNAK